MERFDVRVFRPFPYVTEPVDTIDLDPSITELTFASALPGGWQSLSVGYDTATEIARRFAMLPRSTQAGHLSHVEVYSNATQCWGGRVNKLKYGGGEVRGFGAVGYAFDPLQDGIYSSTNNVQVSVRALLTDVLGVAAPTVTRANDDLFQDPGTAHSYVSFSGRTPGQCLDQIVTEGNANGQIYDYAVYEKRLMTLKPRIAPVLPHYTVPVDDTVNLEEDSSSMWGAVAVTYTDIVTGVAAQTNTSTDGTFADRYGITRTLVRPGGTLSASAATALAQTYLLSHNTPTVQGTITRANHRGLEVSAGGQEQPPQFVRSGEWVQVGNRGPYCIIRTTYAAMTGDLTVELGAPAWGFAQVLAELGRVVGHIKGGTNPNTGAPR